MANCPQLAGSRGKGDRFYAPSHSLRRSLAAVCVCGSPFRSYELISSTRLIANGFFESSLLNSHRTDIYAIEMTMTICCVDERNDA